MKSESRIQQEIVQWFRNNYCLKHHNPQCIIFSVPNERSDKFEQMRMVQTGLLSGVSDLVVIISGRVIFIECKDDKGRQTDKQREFEGRVQILGFEYHLIRDLDTFQNLVNTWNLKKD